jgi:hypothetical protein
MANGQEIEAIRQADEDARAKLISAVLKSVGSSRFMLDIHSGIVNFSDGANIHRFAQPISDWGVVDMRNKIAQCLGLGSPGSGPPVKLTIVNNNQFLLRLATSGGVTICSLQPGEMVQADFQTGLGSIGLEAVQ